MLEFKKTFSVETDIHPFIAEQRKLSGIPDGLRLSVKVVGQEQDGTIIYTWNDPFPAHPDNTDIPSGDVTYVGIFAPGSSRTNKKIFVHDKVVDIVNATINQEHTFLGFVIVERELMVNAYEEQHTQEIHRAYLAEIAPQNRVFYLNLERDYHIALRFLYGQYKRNNSARESHLLVFLHKKSIGLYHVPMARVGSDGVIMSEEPTKKQIFHKAYEWASWDANAQRLHVVYHHKMGEDQLKQKIYRGILKSYQFNAETVSVENLEVQLDLPIYKSRQSSTYLHLGPCTHLPDAGINMEVLTHPNGTTCICFQHPFTVSTPGKRSEAGVVGDAEELVSIQYSVLMVHHNTVLLLTGPSLPRQCAERCRIYFTWLDGYLLAYLPGIFTHLLNVAAEYETANHILWQDTSFHIEMLSEKMGHHNVSFVQERSLPMSGSGMGMYNVHVQCGYKLSVCPHSMCELFATPSFDIGLRLAIIHYAVAQKRDLMLTKSLLKLVAEDPTHPSVVICLSEVLVGLMYSNLKRKIDRNLLKYFSSTTTASMHGLPESNSKNRVQYHPLGHVTLKEIPQHKSSQADDTYENLAIHRLASKQHRFNSMQVLKEPESTRSTASDQSSAKRRSQSPEQGFFKNLGKRLSFSTRGRDKGGACAESPRPPSRSETLLGPAPIFCLAEAAVVKLHADQQNLVSRMESCVCRHLHSILSDKPAQTLEKIAQEYTSCQIDTVRHLAHLIWAVAAPDSTKSDAPLCEAGSREELELFFTYERYVLSLVETGFPITAPFHAFFTKLAFRCVEFRMFLQYVDAGVVFIDEAFGRQLLENLDDSTDNVALKFQLLSRLPRRTALACLHHWDHPESQRFLARDYTHACLNSDLQSNWPVRGLGESEISQFIDDGDQHSADFFPSLSTFIHMLEDKDPHLSGGERGITPAMLTQAALQYYNDDQTAQ